MKYGIKINATTNVIENIDFFEDNQIHRDYLEITETQYNLFINSWQPYSKYVNGSISNDPIDEADYLAQSNIERLRSQLRNLSIEIGLAARMNEDTTILQSDFDALKLQYEGLVSPPKI